MCSILTIKNPQNFFNFSKRGIPLVILGLPNAGKTTFVNRVLTGQFKPSFPTMGVQVESVEIGDALFNIFDLGGHESFRKTIWLTYLNLAYGMLFFLDSTDKENLDKAKYEFWRCIENKDDGSDFFCLFICNKSDLKASLSIEYIINKLELNKLVLRDNISFQFFKISLKTGENFSYVLNWLKKHTRKLLQKKHLDPLMFMLTNVEGFPLLKIDKINIKEDSTLISGFMSAIETFSNKIFGEKSSLQLIISGSYKYIIYATERHIYSMIIKIEDSHEEARRIIQLMAKLESEVNNYKELEEQIIKILKINMNDESSQYEIERAYKTNNNRWKGII